LRRLAIWRPGSSIPWRCSGVEFPTPELAEADLGSRPTSKVPKRNLSVVSLSLILSFFKSSNTVSPHRDLYTHTHKVVVLLLLVARTRKKKKREKERKRERERERVLFQPHARQPKEEDYNSRKD